jgi:hypothetical protein
VRLSIDYDDHYLLSAHIAAGLLYVIDLRTNQVLKTIPDVPGADGVEFVPELRPRGFEPVPPRCASSAASFISLLRKCGTHDARDVVGKAGALPRLAPAGKPGIRVDL